MIRNQRWNRLGHQISLKVAFHLSQGKDVVSDKPENKPHSSTESGQDGPTTPSLKSKGRKRKHTNADPDKLDAFGELLGKIRAASSEKRLKYEAEREVEQRREEHMFQLQIMQMMSGSFYGPPPLHNASALFAFGSVPGNGPTLSLPTSYQSIMVNDHTNI